MKRERKGNFWTLSWMQVYARELLARLRKTPTEELTDVYPFPDRLWDKLRHNGVRVKGLAVGHLPGGSRHARRLRAWEWELYKASCPKWVPWVLYTLERQWTGLFERKRRRVSAGGSVFADLPPAQRAEAENLFNQFCERWTLHEMLGDKSTDKMPAWMKPLLVGVARRLALDPSNRSPEWGRKMLRIKGGKHVQQRYRQQGWHPLPSVRKAWGLNADRPHGDPPPTLRLPSDAKL